MLEGFGLLVGHMIGDFCIQNDWMAANKANVYDKNRPDCLSHHRKGYLACAIHCLLYTLAVFVCSFWWMPIWGLIVCFTVHWFIDRFRLAKRWVNTKISGQQGFANGPLAPWSVIGVDNTWHLATLFIIGMIHFGVR